MKFYCTVRIYVPETQQSDLRENWMTAIWRLDDFDKRIQKIEYTIHNKSHEYIYRVCKNGLITKGGPLLLLSIMVKKSNKGINKERQDILSFSIEKKSSHYKTQWRWQCQGKELDFILSFFVMFVCRFDYWMPDVLKQQWFHTYILT